jgi:hypothetical protein
VGRERYASDRLLRCSFSLLCGSKTNDAAIPFQNSEFVLYVLFAAGLERYLSAARGPTSEMVKSDVSRRLKWKEEIFYLDSP